MNRYLAGSIVMSALLVVYLGFAVVYASILLQDDSLFVNAMGLAMVVLPILGAWGLFAEWRFGVRSSRLRGLLDDESGLPDFPTHASGRFDRDQAKPATNIVEDTNHSGAGVPNQLITEKVEIGALLSQRKQAGP